jgi:hypothetical protein
MKFQIQAISDLTNDLMNNNIFLRILFFCSMNIWFFFYLWIPMITIYWTIFIPCIMEINIYDNINALVMIYKCNVKF